MTFSSRIPGFHKLTQDEKLDKLKELVELTDEEIGLLKVTESPVTIENIIGVMTLPIGLATNFVINGRERFITFAVEEASVVAAASNLAKMTRDHGGFETSNTGALMIGQIQVLDLQMPYYSAQQIHSNKDKILKLANEQDPILVKFGGGAQDLETRVISTASGDMLIVHLIVNCLDAMGANAVNTMAEAIAPMIADLTDGNVKLRIISNLADKRIVRARAVFDKELLGGDDVVEAMIDAWAFAEADPYRAATHNKGIMNAISAVTVATANDWRAIEAGAHAYASRFGYYTSLTRYEVTEEGHLAGTIELPVAVGIVGGATRVHPTAQINLKIMQTKTAMELAEIIACAGLAQNAAALRALSDEGIQHGHMRLHARNLAGSLDGVTSEEIDLIAQKMIDLGQVRADKAEEILNQIRSN